LYVGSMELAERFANLTGRAGASRFAASIAERSVIWYGVFAPCLDRVSTLRRSSGSIVIRVHGASVVRRRARRMRLFYSVGPLLDLRSHFAAWARGLLYESRSPAVNGA